MDRPNKLIKQPPQPGSRVDFEIACFCALSLEHDTVEAVCDGIWEKESSYGKVSGDPNVYITGWISGFNVVLVATPGISKRSSTIAAAWLRSSFPNIKLALVVGICGATPKSAENEEIFLGDVIISTGVIEHDIGRQFSNRLVRTDMLHDTLNRPTSEIRAFFAKLKYPRSLVNLRLRAWNILEQLQEQPELRARYPGLEEDKLFDPLYRHKHQEAELCTICAACKGLDDPVCVSSLAMSCTKLGCKNEQLVGRKRGQLDIYRDRRPPGIDTSVLPQVHFGGFAPSDFILKSGYHRDRLAAETKVIAFENVGCVIWQSFSTIIIRGVCDYADNHKNEKWQNYAAASAAAYMKALLAEWNGSNASLSELFEARTAQPEAPATDSGYASMGVKSSLAFEQKAEDTMSINTDNEQLMFEPKTKEQLILAFANEVILNLRSDLESNQDNIRNLIHMLPNILREFSIELREASNPGMEEKAAIFVRHHRERITSAFLKNIELFLYQVDDGDDSEQLPVDDNNTLSVVEKMNMWRTEESDVLVEQIERSENQVEEQEEEVEYLSEGRRILIESKAYIYMLEKIRTVLKTSPRADTILEKIRVTVLEALVSHSEGSTQSREKLFRCTFEIDWNPRLFLMRQYPSQSRQLGNVITITGSDINAQAATCTQYLCQCWPRTGEEILLAIEAALEKFSVLWPSRPFHYEFSTGTSVSLWFHGESISLEAYGTNEAIVDIAQQLMWLGAACQISPDAGEMAFSEPRIVLAKPSVPMFTIDYSTEVWVSNEFDSSLEGKCWHALFQNAVIAKDFPILTRNQREVGLQVPWNIMVGLGCVEQAVVFNNNLVLKGFSTMLVPTKHVKDSVQWHFIYQPDKSRLEYLEAEKFYSKDVVLSCTDIDSLPSYTNFVGWASSVTIQAGAENVNYEDIEYTGSNYCTAGCAFEKVSISGGKCIKADATFCRGNKDTPVYLSIASTYLQKIDFASKIYVVLYDIFDRRAWLVDGATALLHLVCTKLHTQVVRDSPHFKMSAFRFADPSTGLNAAKNALIDEKNRWIPIFEEEETERVVYGGRVCRSETKTTYRTWGFQDLVEQIWAILEQIHDHQTKQLASPQIGLRLTTREKLEGFGFRDIVEGENPLLPRVAMLKSSGKGWVDFTRQIRAITLLGQGFGELIKPRAASNLCKLWKTVPTGRDYLTVCMKSLEKICTKSGNKHSHPLELVQGIYWHKGVKLFEACSGCRTNRFGSTCDRVQILLPPSLGHKTNPKPFDNLEGAVIFGRSSRFRWFWPGKGDPDEGNGEESDVDEDSIVHDSGIGTSIDTSISLNARSSDSGISQQPFADAHLAESSSQEEREVAVVDDEFHTAPTTPI